MSNDLELTQTLFDFLQGTVPQDCIIKAENVPRLTADQAWTVVWFLGGLYWKPSDSIERCDVCGVLFDTRAEGDYRDATAPPYHFCDDCWSEKDED